jgi:hypothetical protein
MIEKLGEELKWISHFCFGIKISWSLDCKINGGNQPCCWLDKNNWLMKKYILKNCLPILHQPKFTKNQKLIKNFFLKGNIFEMFNRQWIDLQCWFCDQNFMIVHVFIIIYYFNYPRTIKYINFVVTQLNF